MLKSSLCDYSDAYVLFKGTITNPNMTVASAAVNNGNKKVIFKICAPFTDCISEINNTQVDKARNIDVVTLMYDLIKYSNNYSKTSGSSWQCFRHKPAVNGNGAIFYFNEVSPIKSFNSKAKIAGQTGANGRKDVEIIVTLKYLSNVLRTLEIIVISYGINLTLIWFDNCIIVSTTNANRGAMFSKTDTKFYVPVVTLSTEDNVKLLQQLKSGFKRTISYNKFKTIALIERPNQYLDYSIDSIFQKVYIPFVSLFENNANRTSYNRYFSNCKSKRLQCYDQ